MAGRRAGLHTLVGAYVLDAMSQPDRAAFEQHLHGCEPCREEVRGLRETSARLSTAVAVAPRPELRQQTLQATARLRQLPPEVGGEAAGPPARSWLSRMGMPGWLTGTGRNSWLVRLAAAGAAVVIAAAVLIGVNVRSMQTRISALQQRDSAITAILSAPDEATVTADIKTGGKATVMMSHHAGALVFFAKGLISLPDTKGYELWLLGPAGKRSVGMLPPVRGDMTGPMLVRNLQPGDHLGVTVEPAGGSGQPTSAPIVMLSLDA